MEIFRKARYLSAVLFVTVLMAVTFAANNTSTTKKCGGISQEKIREFAAKLAYSTEEVDTWVQDKLPFAKYDSQLGWLLVNGHWKDGVDSSWCDYNYGKYGERKIVNYAEKICRINTYGNSFTQCHQVSDGETWQEILAAHIGEPIRNFGVGGWSVYQAYLRMKRQEKQVPADVIIFNIWSDDHYRNLDAWRNIRVRRQGGFGEPTLPYVRVNLEKGEFTEHPNPCPTKKSCYNLCDVDWIVKNFKDDFAFKMQLAHEYAGDKQISREYDSVRQLALTFGINTRIDSAETMNATAHDLHTSAALYSSMRIVELVEKFAKDTNKKVLYVLSCNSIDIARAVREGKRFDQAFADYMKRSKLPYIDLLDEHLKDYARYKIDVDEYIKQYYIGHYNPRGNFFHAWAMKDALVKILDPKPYAYPDAK